MKRQEFIDRAFIAVFTSDTAYNKELTSEECYAVAESLAFMRAEHCPFEDEAVKVTDLNKLPDEHWEKAPDWANWAAMDEDGRWYWFEEQALTSVYTWIDTGGEYEEFEAPPASDWKESLTKR